MGQAAVIHIRGLTVQNTIRFVRERYGASAHERVVAALPAQHRGSFLAEVRDAGWKPLDDTIAYMETARALLAPGDPGFHREVGRLSGRITGSGGFRILLGNDPVKGLDRASFMWRFLYDAGRPEVVSRRAGDVTMRIHDFPVPSRVWCERICGFMEGCLGVLGVQDARVQEDTCVREGGPYCEMRGAWTP